MKIRLLLIATALLIFGWETAQAQFTGGIGRGDSMGQLTIIGDPEPPDSDTRLRLQIMQLGNNVDLSKVRIHWSIAGLDFFTEYLDVDIADNTSIVDIHRNNFIDPVLGLTANGVYIKHIEILNVNEQILGRMSTNISLNNKASSNDRSDLLIYLHHDIETGWHSDTDWEYFSSEYEVPTTMLIPPGARRDNIDTSMDPLLFVHGLWGDYPYWDEEIETSEWNQLGNEGFDIWQFYYPYDMSIPRIGKMLGRALEVLTDGTSSEFNPGYTNASLPIIAHSMGGLVTRSHIQSNEYNDHINKLLMLGTPNNGSLGSYKVAQDITSGSITELFSDNADKHAPAVRQMIPGSNFLVDLNNIAPKILNNGIEHDYMVIAGTERSGAHYMEIPDQHDNVVSVSSTTLRNFGIPLYTYALDHTKIKNPGMHNIISFLNSSEQFSGYNARWTNEYSELDGINSSDAMLLMHIPALTEHIPNIGFEKNIINNSYRITFAKNSSQFKIREEEYLENGHYFFETRTNITNRRSIGFSSNGTINEIDFGRINCDYSSSPPCHWNSIKSYDLSNEYIVEPILTNKWTFPLEGYEVMLIKEDIESNQANVYAQNLTNDPNEPQTSWFLDAAVDSVVFYMSTPPDFGDVETYNFELETPSGIILTAEEAAVNDDLVLVENPQNRHAYFFVRNPEPGIWGLYHNQPVDEVYVSAPIGSDLKFRINRPDPSYYAGERLDFEITRTISDDLNIQISGNAFLINEDGSQTLVETLTIEPAEDGDHLVTSITPEAEGTYRFEFVMEATGQELSVSREQQFQLFVDTLNELNVPQALFPEEGSTDITNYVNLEWLPVDEAEAYTVQVYRINESESPDDKISDLSDSELIIEGTVEETELALENLQLGSDYIWRVKAIGEDAASEWSEGSGFSNASNEYTLLKSNGWQLVGLPLEVFNNSVDNIYPNALSNTLFNYDGTYSPAQELQMGKGYWIRYGEPESESIVGEYLGFVEIELNPGWNLISPASFSISPESIVDFDGIIDSDLIFGFEGSYFKPDILYPGSGYWLYANENGIITINDSSEQPEILAKRSNNHDEPSGFNTINIASNEIKLPELYFGGEMEEDALIKYLLPPKPPSGIADARLSNGKTLTTDSDAIIEVQQPTNNLLILSIEAAESGQVFNVSEFHGNHLISEQEVIDGDELQLNENTKRLLVTIKQDADMDELPKEFALAQNYPNPFNPVTNLEYSLPEDVNVRLDIYNTLGQRVATLHDGPQVAGRYIINFDASHLASGLYIYRLQAGDFVETRKMLLVK